MRKNAETKDAEAAQLAEFLCNDTNVNKANDLINEMSSKDVNELCTTILANGHTILHLLAQRQKLNSLRAVLQRGADVHTRNGNGDTPLHVALHHNALFSAKVLIDHGANTCEVVSRRKGTTLLHLMVTCDRPHAVILLLEEKADANVRDKEGRTPFHLAAIYGNTVIAAVLIRHEACDVNAVDAAGHTALMLAILNNNQELARQLVDAPRVDTVSRDKNGMACLHLAVANGQLEVVRTILRRNTAHINGKEHRMGRTPIHFACALTCPQGATTERHQYNTILDEEENDTLTSSISDEVDCRNSRISLNMVAEVNKSSTERHLRGDVTTIPSTSNGVKTSSRRRVTHPDSHSQCHKENRPLSTSSSHSAPSPRSQTSLMSMSPEADKQSGESAPNTPRAKRSVRTAGSPRASDTSTPRQKQNRFPNRANHTTAPTSPLTATDPAGLLSTSKQHVLHSIADEGRPKSPRVQHGAQYFGTPKHRASLSGPVNKLHRQRPATAPVSHQNHRPTNVSIFSTSHPGYKIPSVFHMGGVRENATSHRFREGAIMVLTPLNLSLIRSRLVSLLLEHGADANLMTAFRKSPLHIAVIMGAADVMALLLPHVTNPNMLSASNRTALHLAAERGHVGMVHQLIGARANLALRDINGMTALHLAASLGHTEVVAVLLRAKADKNSCDFRQMMPLHHASLHGHSEVANMLTQAGARQDAVDNDGFLPSQYANMHKKASVMDTDTINSIIPFIATDPTISSSQYTAVSLTEVTPIDFNANCSAGVQRGAVSHHGAVHPTRLPPASTLDNRSTGRVLTRIPAGKEAVFHQPPVQNTIVDLSEDGSAVSKLANYVNGTDHPQVAKAETSHRRRKAGVFQNVNNTSLQSVETSTYQHQPIPKVLYNGIPQAN